MRYELVPNSYDSIPELKQHILDVLAVLNSGPGISELRLGFEDIGSKMKV